MTYNVENLFDTVDDPHHKDETFLPYAKKKTKSHIDQCLRIKRRDWRDECLFVDWNEKVLHQKLSQLARVVNHVSPEVLVLQEVENKEVLSRWVKDYLTDTYRSVVLLEGKDYRGIDVAIVSRFELNGTPVLHDVALRFPDGSIKGDARGILEANLILPNGQILSVYANHFPAPFHPKSMRIQAFEKLAKLVQSNPHPYAVAAGDFNVPGSEDQKYKILKTYVAPHWKIAHKDCDECAGTQYYPPKKTWSFLDMILVSKKSDARIVPGGVFVEKESWMLTQKGKPKSFSVRSGNGASDHLPLVAKISIQK